MSDRDDDLEATTWLSGQRIGFEIRFDATEFASGVWRDYSRKHPEPRGSFVEGESDEDEDRRIQAWRAWQDALSVAYQDRLASELEEAVPGSTWLVGAKHQGDLGGPLPPDVARLVFDATQIVTGIGGWIFLGQVIKSAWPRLERLFKGKPPSLNAYSAAAVAADVIRDAGGAELTFAFATAIQSTPMDEYGGVDSYVVGFRDAEAVWVAFVSLAGNVTHLERVQLPSPPAPRAKRLRQRAPGRSGVGR